MHLWQSPISNSGLEFGRVTLDLNRRVVFAVKGTEDERERKSSQNKLREGKVEHSVNI